jgi:apolipoprotein D and lipocalin family protein
MTASAFRATADTAQRWFSTSKPPPTTVAEIDLDRFMGSWFEVARLPNLEADGFGQRGVDVTVTYQKRPDGTISVRTVSYNAKARMRRTEVNGTVRPTNPGQSQLLLTFFHVIRGRLWVVALDEEYRWALMGTPSRRRLWLISRSPRLAEADDGRAMAIAVEQGYDAARSQPGQHRRTGSSPVLHTAISSPHTVNVQERGEADGAQAKARDVDQAREGPRGHRRAGGHSITTSLVAETP